MKTYLVVTITCPDRPGIVERLTELLVAHAANWEESRMARLGGDFAGIVKIGVAPESVELIGELDDFPTHVSNYIISPFVGVIPWPYPVPFTSMPEMT